jgi:hypothetical protein
MGTVVEHLLHHLKVEGYESSHSHWHQYNEIKN